MKVCTDSCLFGAWIAEQSKEKANERVLDIGAGTGLLSLMYAQKSDSKIDAIEIDIDAAIQAKENINASSWKNKINVINESLLNFQPAYSYDFIFSNPPFFEDDLISANEQKNKAKHNTSLTLKDLISFISNHLNSDGAGALLIPYHRLENLKSLLNEFNFHIHRITLVKQSIKHHYFRAMLNFSGKECNEYVTKEIVIKDSDGNYTDEFIELLKEYYLKLF
jgi:tRNA1Val (adenine37-N6)-methyltransferase